MSAFSPQFATILGFFASVAYASLILISLIVGWIIHPYTVGGFTRWVQSPIQQFSARIGTSVGAAIATAIFGYSMLFQDSPPKINVLNSEQTHTPSVSVSTQLPDSFTSSSNSSDDRFAEQHTVTPDVTKPLPPPAIKTERPAVELSAQQSDTPLVTPKNMIRDITITQSDPEVVDTPKNKYLTKSNEDNVKFANDSLHLKIAELKGGLVVVDAKIQSERARWQEGVKVINQLTNFKKTPVREGSPQYHQCMAASRVIKEVESGAAGLKAEKARLEVMISSLEGK
jgi:hypothetical protein